MTYWKKLRRSERDAVSFVLENSSDDEDQDQCTSQEFNRITQSPSPTNEMDTIGNDDHETDDDFDEINDFGFLEEELSSDTEQEAEILDNEPNEENATTLAQDLAEWATEFPLPREGVNRLLKILIKQGHRLPKDSRTLMQTPQTVDITDKCGGSYKYYGIESGLLKILEQNITSLEKFNTIKLLVNIDGVPLFKSSGTQFWPILCSFENFSPYLVALYYGKSKPTSVSEFLREFLEELSILEHNGIIFEGKKINISLNGFVCDAPARSYLKCVKNHTGYYSCERCTIRGYYKSSIVVFYSVANFPGRTSQDFLQMKYEDHQLGRSPLIDYNINCVNGFCLDYTHLVCLGVVKRILWYLKHGPKECKISARQISEMSDELISLNGKFPSEFARQPRTLYELERYKATEFRQFLLYSGPVVLKKSVPKQVYEHFLVLTVAVSILLDSNDEKRKFQKYVIRLLLESRKDHEKIMRLKEPEAEFELNTATNLAELEELENMAQDKDKRKQITKRISVIGGVDPKDAVRNILKRLMTNDVMAKFNMKGKRGKKAFEELELCKLVTETAAAFNNCTEHDALTTIAATLKYAPDRMGGGGRIKE